MIRRTKQEWQTMMAEWDRTGETAEIFARRKMVNPGTLKWWRTKLRREADTSVALVRVDHSSSEATGIVNVTIDGIELHFDNASAEFVGAVVAVVRQRC